jgi:hypothetical protein
MSEMIIGIMNEKGFSPRRVSRNFRCVPELASRLKGTASMFKQERLIEALLYRFLIKNDPLKSELNALIAEVDEWISTQRAEDDDSDVAREVSEAGGRPVPPQTASPAKTKHKPA